MGFARHLMIGLRERSVLKCRHRERFPRSWRCSQCMAGIPEIGLSNGGNSPGVFAGPPLIAQLLNRQSHPKLTHHWRKRLWTV